MTVEFAISLLILAGFSFIQNMAFTAVSRSRNSGDPQYHRWCAYASNSIWFVTHFMVLKQVWGVLESGLIENWWRLLLVGIVYGISTAEGSVTMMKRLLKTESGKRRVGAKG